jgi:hypothetical protein
VVAEPLRDPTTRLTRRRVYGLVAVELVAVIVSFFLGLTAMGHIVQTNWLSTFFYNGDSLALPLIQKSIERGEPFEWVFSSQNYLFPEGPLYILATIFGRSVRSAMLINGVFNVVALYLLLRSIARQLAHRSRHRLVEILTAVAATGLFVIFVLLEPTPDVNGSGTASLFLFSTYYDGVILSGLAIVALTLWFTRAFGPVEWGQRRFVRYTIAVVVLTTLTSFSNPLYLLQVVAPLAVAAIVLVFLDRISWRQFGALALPTTAGVVVAVLLRLVFARTFASSVGSYVSLRQIPKSIHILLDTLRAMIHSSDGLFTIILLGGILLVTFALLIFALYAQARPNLAHLISTSEVFIVAFVSFSTVSLALGMVASGSPTTRYLEPIYLFPLLTVVSIGIYVLRRLLVGVERVELRRSLSRFALGIAAVAAILVIVVGAINIAPLSHAATGAGYTDAKCFDKFVGDKDINGVGSYWSVRTLAVYGDSKGEILQVNNVGGPLGIYPWITNVGAYRGTHFSFVVADSSGQVTPDGLATLGKPRQVISCSGYLIYDYRGTKGEATLNREISSSLPNQG